MRADSALYSTPLSSWELGTGNLDDLANIRIAVDGLIQVDTKDSVVSAKEKRGQTRSPFLAWHLPGIEYTQPH